MSEKLTSLAHLRRAGVNPLGFLAKALYYRLRGKNIKAHPLTRIRGFENIEVGHAFDVGLEYGGFTAPFDRTWINVEGKLVIPKYFHLGRVCRLDVNKGATLTLKGGRMGANSNIIVNNSVTIGEGASISWGVEILDEDFHTIEYEGRVDKDPQIVIGDHVWIGSYVRILKGVKIGNGCVIASSSVVTKSFEGENLLIGGNPARVLKENVRWS